MSKFCKHCGSELNESAKFCTSCGQKVEQDSDVNISSGDVIKYTGVQRRSIPLAIILSFVTCALYVIYWQVKLTDDVNTLLGRKNATSGLMAVIYTIVTCGIYGIYWIYKMGENVDELKGREGSTGLLYLILGVLGLGIIPMALIQDTINDKVDGVF